MSMIKNGGKVLYTKNLEMGDMHKIKENIWWNSQTPTFMLKTKMPSLTFACP
jgi:hypothetical protein